jgi:DNA-binding transcriptional MerR regulator
MLDEVSTTTTQHHYSIKQAAAATGLPASTLRYYESVGVISPVGRGDSSGHRVYNEADLDQLLAVACLAALGMSVSDMRDYIANVELGQSGATKQVELLSAQQRRLEIEAEHMKLRQRYVQVKVAYWQAIEAGDDAQREVLEQEARSMMNELKRVGKQ